MIILESDLVYLLQSGDYLRKEKSAVNRLNLPRIACSFNELSHLSPGNYIPVGTVEFTKEYCRLNNIKLPENISYPTELSEFLGRSVWLTTYADVPDNLFVKPQDTKVFTGAIKHTITESVTAGEVVWASDPVMFEAEFRYYIVDHAIVGYSRYDDGDDEATADDNIVKQMVACYTGQPVGYTIDVGIVDGKTQLIEVNDGWAIGLYPWGTMTNESYVELITKRWAEITA